MRSAPWLTLMGLSLLVIAVAETRDDLKRPGRMRTLAWLEGAAASVSAAVVMPEPTAAQLGFGVLGLSLALGASFRARAGDDGGSA